MRPAFNFLSQFVKYFKIKTERKPLKITYKNYNNTEQGGTIIIPLPNNLRSKNGFEQGKKLNVKEFKKINIKRAEDTSTSNKIKQKKVIVEEREEKLQKQQKKVTANKNSS